MWSNARQTGRRKLDTRLFALKPATQYAPPRIDWPSEIRDAFRTNRGGLERQINMKRHPISDYER